MADVCGACRFYNAIDEADGLCKRHAPHPILVTKEVHDLAMDAWADWPTVERDNWCGEFTEESSGRFNAEKMTDD